MSQTRNFADIDAESRMLISGLLHDLIEPARTVHCSVEVIRKKLGSGTSDVESWLSLISGSAMQIHRFVDQFRALLLADEPAMGEVNMREVVEAAIGALDASVREAEAIITIDELPVVCGDEVALGRLVQNLVANAIKFRGAEPPVIHIGCRSAQNTWVFSVVDNGMGIERKYQGEIFAPFRRLHSSSKYSGSGLGLAICRKIVEAHGGLIWVESCPGVGSTIFFSLQRNEPHSDWEVPLTVSPTELPAPAGCRGNVERFEHDGGRSRTN